MHENSRVLITGGHSAVALALKALLAANGYENIASPDREEVDLTDLAAVQEFFQKWKPDYVLHIAGRTADAEDFRSAPWEIFRDNLLMEYNIFESSIQADVAKMVWISSDSALPYSPDANIQTENNLLHGPPKKKREPYALAKLMGIKMCEYINRQQADKSFVSLLPCFIYGNVRKGLLYEMTADFIMAKRDGRKEVRIWGNADLQYKLIHCQDVASAIFFVMSHQMKHDTYVVAPVEAISKVELAHLISDYVGYEGEILFDESKPIMPAANASSARLRSEGWAPTISLENGIKEYVDWIEQGGGYSSARLCGSNNVQGGEA